jgi:hypothetical protein
MIELKELIKLRINAEEYYILNLMYEDEYLAEEYLQRLCLCPELTLKNLRFNGYIKKDIDAVLKHSLTKNALKIVENHTVETNNKKPAKIDSSDWIDEYRKLFLPARGTNSRSILGDRKACIDKMNKFLKTYPYNKNTVLAATKNYINSKHKDRYAYTQCADYFIFKDNISTLAAECESLGTNGIIETGSEFIRDL